MKKFGLIIWLVLLLRVVAVAQRFPEFPVQPASQYSSCQTKHGIRVAIEPISAGDQQKKYFGAKFESQGFLPVLVVLENASEDSSALLRRDLVTYAIGDVQASSVAGDVSAKSKTGAAVAVAGFAAISLPAMVVGLKMIAAASEVKQNILVKELRSQTLAPGKAGSGFLYVPIGKPGTEKRKVVLNVPLALGDSQESLVFTFELEAHGGGNQK